MNDTNRFLNRLGIFLFGFVLLVLGAAAAIAALVPEWLGTWKDISADVRDNATTIGKATLLAGPGTSWILIVIVVVCAALIALLLTSIFRQGHGQTRVLYESGTPSAQKAAISSGGSVIVTSGVVQDALGDGIGDHPGLVSSSVSTYRVGKTPAVKITANVRRGVAPREIRAFIDRTVLAWDSVLGSEVPVLVQINAGLRTRVARSTRLAPQRSSTASEPTHAQPPDRPALTERSSQ